MRPICPRQADHRDIGFGSSDTTGRTGHFAPAGESPAGAKCVVAGTGRRQLGRSKSTELYARSLDSRCWESIWRIVPDLERMTRDWV